MRSVLESLQFRHLIGLALAGLIACGGGGGATTEARVPSETQPPIVHDAPQLSVLYPPPVSTATAQRLTVRGTAQNAASVTVNGVAAQTSGDAWTADVVLPMGTRALDVKVTGLDGTLVQDSRLVTYDGPQLQRPYDVVYDARRDRLIVADEQLRSLFTVDIVTGERALLFESPDAPEPTSVFRLLKPLEIDAARNAVLYMREDGRIDSIDLDSGEATRIVDGNEDYFIVQPRAMALDPGSRNLYVADRAGCTLHEINLDTRAHRIASDFASGGTDLHFRDIFWDTRRQHVVVAGTGRAGGAVIRVNMQTGYRTNLNLGMANPDAMSYDPITDVAFITDEPSMRVYDRGANTVSARLEPAAPDFGHFASVAVRPGTTLCYIVDDINDSIVVFDRADGSFRRIGGDRVGEGPALGAREGDGILAMTGDAARGRTLVAVEFRERYNFIYPNWFYDTQFAILAIDGRTGERTVLAADASVLGKKIVVGARGSGASLGRPASLAVDPVTDRVLVLDSANFAIVSLDPVTGDRTTLPTPSNHSAAVWTEMVIDAPARQAVVRTAAQQLLSIDLDSGAVSAIPRQLPADVTGMTKIPGSSQLLLNTAGSGDVQVFDLASNAAPDVIAVAPGVLGAPVVLDLHADGGSGQVLVLSAAGIATIDPATMTVRPLVTAQPGAFFPIEPERICADEADGCLKVITSGTARDLRGLFAIDPVSGTVVVASKE